MTREETKALLPVMQAWAEGKAIQVRISCGRWEDYKGVDPGFNNNSWEWRLKPEPREWTIEPEHGPDGIDHWIVKAGPSMPPYGETVTVIEKL